MIPEDMSGGTGGGGQVPEAWIGQRVTAGFALGGLTPYTGTLESVSDRGVGGVPRSGPGWADTP